MLVTLSETLEIQRGPWDYLVPDNPSLGLFGLNKSQPEIQPACGALSRRLPNRRGTLALLANTTSTGTPRQMKGHKSRKGRTVIRHCGRRQRYWWLLQRQAPALAPCAIHPCALRPCAPHPCPYQLFVWQPLCRHQPAAATNCSAWAQQQPA